MLAYSEMSDEFPDLEFAEADLLFHQSESGLQEMKTLIQIEENNKEVRIQRNPQIICLGPKV